MAWRIEITDSAKRTLRKLDKPQADRIRAYLKEIEALDDPHIRGKALVGHLWSYWRYRLGDYRIICDIQQEQVTVLVLRIGHRRQVYDDK